MAVHITFRTPNLSQSEFILRRSAGRFGVDDVRCYTPEHPAVQLARSQNPLIMAFPRGAGYWLWKPYIILDALRSVPPGTAVLYTDVAVTYVADPAPLFSLLQIDDVVLFENWPFNLQRGWTKRHAFIRLDADSPEYWNRRQLDAAFQLYRAGSRAIEFVEATREAMCDPRVLIDTKNVSETKELDGYSEHRHDQSVLTIMAQKWGIRTFRAPSRPPETEGVDGAPGPYRQLFYQHRRRDTTKLRFLLNMASGVYDGRYPKLRSTISSLRWWGSGKMAHQERAMPHPEEPPPFPPPLAGEG